MRPERDEIYLRCAELFAERATCVRRKVGCVIVDEDGRILATGYNGVAAGRPHCNEGFPCEGAGCASGEGLDQCEAIHAEQNAILFLGDPRKAHTIYVTVSPCLSCMKLLLGTAARRIVTRELYPHEAAMDWWARAGGTIDVLK